MTVTLSQRLQRLQPSATMAMGAKAKELKAGGKQVYDFSMGEPDFTTPAHICEAAQQAMRDGHTHYTQAPGIPELREAVARNFTRTHGVQYTAAQVVVSNGAKHSLHNIFTTLIDPGDEVIIPAPYWVSYAELVQLAEGKPVIVNTSEADTWKLTPAALREAITSKTRMLLLCSPSNPTGSMYSREELIALADVCVEQDLLVVSDEIYEQLIYGDATFTSFVAARPGLAERTVLVNGVSKTYAMTGWRIGWTLAPPEVSKAMSSLQSQETSNPSSISQYAALAAVTGPQECVAEMREAFAARQKFVRQRISEIPGLSASEMHGAFYAFINISQTLGRKYGGRQIDHSADWCLALLEQQQVGTVMGSAFGAEGFARLSYAASMEQLETGFERIEAFVKSGE